MKKVSMIAVTIASIASAQTVVAKDAAKVGEYAFIMPSDWVLLPERARSQRGTNEAILFRRFSVATHLSDFKRLRSGETDEVQLIGQTGTFYNSMIFNCVRKKVDYLTLHLPSAVSVSSFESDGWKSSMEVRILANGVSIRSSAEYINRDIFLDAANFKSNIDFLHILAATEIITEFGERGDRLNLFVSDQLGKANLAYAEKEMIPKLMNAKAHFLNTTEMLAKCRQFKRTGAF
jgi:hypothetical protein